MTSSLILPTRRRFPSFMALLFLLLAYCQCPTVDALVPAEVRQQWKSGSYSVEDALQTIERAAEEQKDEDYDLYYATRYIDRIAHTLYDDKDKKELWQKAKGSWELRLAYQDSRKDLYFYPYPDFRDFAMAYIMIDDDYFGKGIATSDKFSLCAMGGPCKQILEKRQLYMDYQDFYINGNAMPEWDLSYFMRGYARNWYAAERKRPPLAFTIIACTPTILVVRGSKTGGMAVFRRIKSDMRPASYGSSPWKENTKNLWKEKQEDRRVK